MSEVTDQLLAIRQKTLQTPETKVDTVPVEVASASGTTTEAPESATPNEPKEQTEATTEQKVAKVETPEPAKGWDDTPEELVKSSSPEINWNELGSALEFGETKTREEFLTKTSELKSKLKTYEEKPFEGVPEEFRSVIEVAKTGDWKDYLANQLIDYTKLDPIYEFETDFFNRAEKNLKYFTDGKFDPKLAEEALDTIPESIREVHGQQIIQALAYQQAQRKQQIEQKAQARRQQADTSLADATRKLGELLPLDNYGIKFEPKHASEIYQGITSSKLTKKHLGISYEDLVRSGADMKAVVRSITLAEKGEKMIAFKADGSKTQAKKEILNTLQNVQLNTTGTNLNPDDPEKKIETPAEKLAAWKASQRRGL